MTIIRGIPHATGQSHYSRSLRLILGSLLFLLFLEYSAWSGPGDISTVAGNGLPGFSENLPATQAMLNLPQGVTVDARGNLYISDSDNDRIRKVDTNGFLTTIAKNEMSQTLSWYDDLYFLAVGKIFSKANPDNVGDINGSLSDMTRQAWYRVRGYDPHPTLQWPRGITTDSAGNIYFVSSYTYTVRKIAPDGSSCVVAGTGYSGYGIPDWVSGTRATDFPLTLPTDVAVDGSGKIYVADGGAGKVYEVDPSGMLKVFAGNGQKSYNAGDEGGCALSAALGYPEGLAIDKRNGNVYIADANNNLVRVVHTDVSWHPIYSIAGTGQQGYSGDGGPARSARICQPSSVAVDSSGNVYFVDRSNWVVRMIGTNGYITTVAGNGDNSYAGDGGPALEASFCYPRYIALDATGNLFIAETGSSRIRKVESLGKLFINGGAKLTNSTTVLFCMNHPGATQMQFSNDNATWSVPEPFQTMKLWTMASGDGAKTVYVKFRDAAGNWSQALSDTITLDTTPPNVTITVNNGSIYADVPQVTLHISGSDLSGIKTMAFSNEDWWWNTNESQPQPFAPDKAWDLSVNASYPRGEGLKAIYGRFWDKAGNWTDLIQTKVMWDSQPPANCGVVINGGAAYTNTAAVSLALSASDLSPIDKMQLSNDGINWSPVMDFASPTPWTMTPDEGTKTVYAKMRDKGGHWSSAASDGITVDATPPTGSIVINNQDTYTTSTVVTLTLAGNDAGAYVSGGLQMQFSNDGSSWSNWQAFTATRAWTLPANDGTKTVFMRLKDLAGNVSAPISDSIILDAIPPAGSFTINGNSPYTNTTTVTLFLSCRTSNGISRMLLSNDGVNWSAPLSLTATKPWALTPGDGLKTVYAKFQDNFGYWSPVCSDSITYNHTITPLIITTLAGNGASGFGGDGRPNANGFTGDGGPAAAAIIGQPRGVAVDAVGNVYVADELGGKIRKIDAAGIITNILDLYSPEDVAVDHAGNIYVIAGAESTIKKMTPDGVVSVVAGNGTRAYSGDGGPAASAALNGPQGIAVDSSGTLFIADTGNNRVRKVQSGIITTVAGTGGNNYSFSNGPATSLAISPWDVAADQNGNLFIADRYGMCVRKVDSGGQMTVVAGNYNASWHYSQDGVAATSTGILPVGIAVDGSGNLYISDGMYHVIRKVDAAGIISTFAGTGTCGYSGDGGPALSAQLNNPNGVTVDSAGNVYIPDVLNQRVRQVHGFIAVNGGAALTSTRNVSLNLTPPFVSGCAEVMFSNDNAAWTPAETYDVARAWTLSDGDGFKTVYAQFKSPEGVWSQVYSDTIMLDTTAPDTLISTGPPSLTSSTTANFSIRSPEAGCVFEYKLDGDNYVACAGSVILTALADGSHTFMVRAIDPVGNMDPTPASWTWAVDTVPPETTITQQPADPAGSNSASFSFAANESGCSFQCHLDSDPYTTHSSPMTYANLVDGSHTFTVRAIDSAGNVDSTPATYTWTVDAAAPVTTINVAGGSINRLSPARVTVTFDQLVTGFDSSDVSVTNGEIGNFSGSGASYAFDVTPAANGTVRVDLPAGAGVDANNNPSTAAQCSWVYDTIPPGLTLNPVSSPTTALSVVTTGTVEAGATVQVASDTSALGGVATVNGTNWSFTVVNLTAGVNHLTVTARDAAGNTASAMTTVTCITRTISTVAGRGQYWGYEGDGGPATQARIMFGATDVKTDRQGNIYIVDANNQRVRMVDKANGYIWTIAGSGNWGFAGDGGPATAATLFYPRTLSLDEQGNMLVADTGNQRVRRVDALSGIISTLLGNGSAIDGGENGPANMATMCYPMWLARDRAGNSYVGNSVRVFRIDPAGTLKAFAGDENYAPMGSSAVGDGGPALAAHFRNITNLATDEAGNVYIVDSGDHRVRRVDAQGIIRTVAGSGRDSGDKGDGGLATAARLVQPCSVAVDCSGVIYIADSRRDLDWDGVQRSLCIRKVDPLTGIMTTVAGGRFGYSGDGGPAANAAFVNPASVAVDSAGALFIADADNDCIRRVSGMININGGACRTNATTVTLSLFPPFDAGAAKVVLSNDGVFDTEAAENYNMTRTWTLTPGDGAKRIYAKFQDPAGYWSGIYSEVIRQDTQATATLNAIPSPITADSITIGGTVETGAIIRVATDTAASDGLATVNGTQWSYTITNLQLGVNNISVIIADPLGNNTTIQASVTREPVIPDTHISMQPAMASKETSATFGFYADKINCTFQYKLDSSAYTTCTSPVTFTSLTEGNHTFSVRATDTLGQSDPTPATYTWRIDTTPPDTLLNSAPAHLTTATSATFTFLSNESNARFQCQLDDNPLMFASSPQSFYGLSDGTHTVSIRAIDEAGNADPMPATYAWTVDTLAPQLVRAASVTAQTADVTFSEPVSGATNLANYAASGGLTLTGVTARGGNVYRLATSVQALNTTYTITASHITDLAAIALDGAHRAAAFARAGNRAPSVPTQQAPADGAKLNTRTPTLSANGSTDADEDPITCQFEVSDRNDFSNIVAAASSLAAGGSVVSWTVPSPLGNNTLYTWHVRANDGIVNSAWSSPATFKIYLAPTDILLSGTSVAEAQTSGTLVGRLSTTDPDTSDTFTYSLANGTDAADNALFTIDGDALKTVAPLDHEARGTYSIRLRSTDAAGLFFEKAFTITASDAPEAPCDLRLSSSIVPDGQPAGVTVGTLSAVDDDTGDTFTYALAGGAGDMDNAAFTIDGNTLKTNQTFDLDLQSTCSIRLRTADSTSQTFEKSFTLTVNRFNKPPVNIIPGLQKTREDRALVFSSAAGNAIRVSDPDAGDNPVKVTLFASPGNLTLGGVAGLTFTAGDGTSDTMMTFTGTIAQINAALEGLTYIPRRGAASLALIQITTDDLGNSGQGGALRDTDTVMVTFIPAHKTNVYAWGYDYYRQCQVPAGLDSAVATACGDNHTAALKADGTVVAWGDNASNQTMVPANLANVVTLAASSDHTFALKADGAVIAWGTDYKGECNIPPGLTGVVAVATGYYHGLALKGDGTVVAWGNNDSQQCNVPAGLSQVVAVAAGPYHSVALKNDGTVVAWGIDYTGKCAVPGGLNDAIGIGAGYAHTAALRADGTVLVWGDNSNGQRNVPAGLTGVISITCGPDNTVAIKSDGAAVGWGSDNYTLSSVPSGLQDVSFMSFGSWHGAFLLRGSALKMLTLSNTSVPENRPAGTPVGTLLTLDPDAGTSVSYALAGGSGAADNPMFTIDGDRLLTSAPLDCEGKGAYHIRVRGTDNAASDVETTFTITATDANDPPTDITISPVRTAMHLAPGDTVGVLHAIDQDTTDTHAWQLVSGPGDQGNALLTITSDTLQAAATIDRPLGGTYRFRVRTTDAAGASFEKALETTAVAVNQPPVVTIPAIQRTSESTTLVFSAATGNAISISDPDIASDPMRVTVTVSSGAFSLGGTSGLTFISGDGTSSRTMAFTGSLASMNAALEGLRFTPPALFTGTALLQISADDLGNIGTGGAQRVTKTVTITVTPATARRLVAWGYDYNRCGAIAVPANLTNVITMSAGGTHNLALRLDGTVAAWGDSYYGKTNVPGGLGCALAIAAGQGHSLAIKTDRTVWAWGDNNYGQCNVPAGLTDAVAIAAGGQHSVALLGNGTVRAWGANDKGQCNVPAGLSGVIAVAAGYNHTLALKTDGTVVAWGDGMTLAWPSSGESVVPAGLRDVVEIQAGWMNSLAFKANGTIVTWGRYPYSGPPKPADLGDVVAVSTAMVRFVALRRDGTAVGWGENNYGETPVPANLNYLVGVKCGSYHTLALQRIVDANLVPPPQTVAQGTSLTLSSSGGKALQLVDLGTGESTITVALTSTEGIMSLKGVAGLTFSQGDGTADRRMIFSGKRTDINAALDGMTYTPRSLFAGVAHLQISTDVMNALGFAGTLHDTDTIPINVTMAQGNHVRAWSNDYYPGNLYTDFRNLIDFSGRDDHALGLRSDGTVVGWGGNYYHQTDPPAGLSGVISVSAGYYHLAALKKDGTVTAWGSNYNGEATVPAGLSGVVGVRAGNGFTLVLKNNGTVSGWPNTAPANSPSGLTDVIDLATGWFHSIALKADGTVVAWGVVFSDGNNPQLNVPPDLAGVVAIAAGDNHNLALKADGTVVAWGKNDYGQCNVPAGLANVVAVAAGANHSLAMKADGTVVAWGDNRFQQCSVLPYLLSPHALTAGSKYSMALEPDLAPTDISLSNNSVWEQQPANTVVGAFSTTDPNVGDTFTYSLVGGLSADDNSSFTIAGNTLKTAIPLDYNLKSTYHIRVRSTDQTGMSVEKPFFISAIYVNKTPVNHIPTIQLATEATSVTFGSSLNNALTIGDVDATTSPLKVTLAATQGTLTLRRTDGLSFTLGDGLADAHLSFTGTVDQVNAALNGLVFAPRRGFTGLALVQITTDDQGNTGAGTARRATDTIKVFVSPAHPTQTVIWGGNDYGQKYVPGNPAGLIDIAACANFTVAIKADTTLLAWGDNSSGQCSIPGNTSGILAVSAGGGHVLALRNDGHVIAWGGNGDGQCNVPANLAGVVAVAAGSRHSLALKADGTVVAWGYNASHNVCSVPGDLSGVIAIAAGNDFSAALKADGTVAVWGGNDDGAALAGPSDLADVTALAVGNNHVLALKADGAVAAWKALPQSWWSWQPDYGQASVPDNLDHVAAIAAGAWHSLALKDDGSVVGWGRSDYGQTSAPWNMTGATAIAAGQSHSLALQPLQAPAALALYGTLVSENQTTGTYVGNFYTTDPNPYETFRYELVGGTGAKDNALFAISGDMLLTNAVFDFETTSTYSIRVRTTDSSGLSCEQAFSIGVLDQNEAPDNLALSQTAIAESQPAGVIVGTFSATDPDTSDTQTYMFVPGTGGDDNDFFTIDGQTLKTAASFDYEDKPAYDILVRCTDGGGLYVEKAFTISVINVNELPQITVPAAQQILQGAPLVFASAKGNALTLADPDGNVPAKVTLATSSGTLTLHDTAGLTFATGSANGTGNLVFTGTVSAINTALDGLVFLSSGNCHGWVPLHLAIDDQGNYGSGGPHSTIADISILVYRQFTLSAGLAGYGQGIITSDIGGINLPGTAASATVVEGTTITLTATPRVGSVFASWSGACRGNGPGKIVMDADKIVTATFITLPVITGHPVSRTVNPRESASFSVAATGDRPFTYQWRYEGRVIAGATSSTLVIAAAQEADEGHYTCVVGNSVGAVESQAAVLSVNDQPKITKDPLALTLDPGATASFVVETTGTQPVAYRWKKGNQRLSDDGRITGTLTATLQIANLSYGDAGSYSCEATNSAGQALSNPVRLVVNPTLTVLSAHGSPQPQGTTVATTGSLVQARVASPVTSGTGVRFVCTGWMNRGASPASGATTQTTFIIDQPTTLTWTWKTQYQLAASASPAQGGRVVLSGSLAEPNGTWLDAASTATLVAFPAPGYVMGAWSGDLMSVQTATQTTVTLLMNRPRSVTATFIQLPSVIRQPVSLTVNPGDDTSFSIAASGTAPLSWQWKHNGQNLLESGRIHGATSDTLRIQRTAEIDEGEYLCVVSNGGGTTQSLVATLTVNDPPQITKNPVPQTLNPGATASFTVATTGTQPMRYRWKKGNQFLSDGGRITGTQTATLQIASLIPGDAGLYCCEATNPAGQALSNPARLVVNPTLTVLSARGLPQPQGTTVATTGSLVQANVASPVAGGTGVRFVCTGWIRQGAQPASGATTQTTFIIDQPTTLTWTWKTQYLLQTAANPYAGGQVAPASGWYDAGTLVTLQATPATDYAFGNWSGAAAGVQARIQLTMDAPRSVTATFTILASALGIHPVPEAAGWTLTGPGGIALSDTGTTTVLHAPIGAYTIAWHVLPGYDAPAPNPASLTLAQNQATTFTGIYVRQIGNVQVNTVPLSGGWMFRDGNNQTHKGTGSALLANIPTGNITLTWLPPADYELATTSGGTLSLPLKRGETVQFTQVFIPIKPGPQRTQARIIAYLLGLNVDPTGLDLNSDGKINVVDLIRAQQN